MLIGGAHLAHDLVVHAQRCRHRVLVNADGLCDTRVVKWRLLADVVLVTHLGFVLFTVLGAVLVLRWRRLALVHVPVVVYGVVIEVAGFRCPLTPLEKSLRRRAGGAGYDGGFVEHYVVPVLYPGEWTAATRIAASVVLVVANASVYWHIRRSRNRSRAAPHAEGTPATHVDRVTS
jgi:hypothetical protein